MASALEGIAFQAKVAGLAKSERPWLAKLAGGEVVIPYATVRKWAKTESRPKTDYGTIRMTPPGRVQPLDQIAMGLLGLNGMEERAKDPHTKRALASLCKIAEEAGAGPFPAGDADETIEVEVEDASDGSESQEIVPVQPFVFPENGLMHFAGRSGEEFRMIASEACASLGIENTSDALKSLVWGRDKGHMQAQRPRGGAQRVLYVTRNGLLRLIFKSRKAEAIAFQDWVLDVVLPAILDTGSFNVGSGGGNEDFLARLERLRAEQQRDRDQIVQVILDVETKAIEAATKAAVVVVKEEAKLNDETLKTVQRNEYEIQDLKERLDQAETVIGFNGESKAFLADFLSQNRMCVADIATCGRELSDLYEEEYGRPPQRFPNPRWRPGMAGNLRNVNMYEVVFLRKRLDIIAKHQEKPRRGDGPTLFGVG